MLSLIVLIGFPILIWYSYIKVRLARQSTAWPTAPGVITAAERVKLGRRIQPRISFSYDVAGKTYASTKISFADAVPASETEPILDRYPLSQPVEVHYQPGNPALAVLEAGPNRQLTVALRQYIFWFCIIICLNILYVGVKAWTVSHDSDTASVPTYDDVAKSDPQLGNRLLRQDADKGVAKDQVYVAVWYLTGTEGYPKDPAEAAKWLRKAADQGDADGENMLGQLYARGNGVEKDSNQAVEWFKKAAAQGEPLACANLGYASEKGLGGMPQDKQKAIEWYRKAGDLPLAKAALTRLGAN